MRYLLRAELFKVKKDVSLWVIPTILICCACISIFTGVYTSAENACLCLGKDYFLKHPHPRVQAAYGMVYLKELSLEEFYTHSAELRKLTENY